MPTIVCLPETKCGDWDKFMKSSVWEVETHGWLSSPSNGLSGGLLTSWDKSIVEYINHQQSENWILLEGMVVSSKIKFVCFNIYSPSNIPRKKILWENLSNIFWNHRDDPVVLIGDFNSVRGKEERENCQYVIVDTTNFNEFITSLGLQEVQLSGNCFSWYGPGNKKSRLDRALGNTRWFERGCWQGELLNKKNSDHKPFSIGISLENWGPKPFRLFD